MFDIGVPELLLILVIGLIFFGPGKLPELGRAIGKSINEFKKETNKEKDVTDENKSFAETTIIDVKEEKKK
ncbi:twin-arginine translocase TatA/TatE family subunit [Pectinatus brassicae]|uniref:Sec-independent protein translocase protein TatA n=1 Tax=Pectinatus brassicae TaxID=862415 RepID=A0A840URA6_9FIRM|nr:twin-arginine translocase TatA/TatE family subunit [Pectinatus brassicae]MBB5335364.1 sec-independent protein translocase protein TatA [Pectinatus brassicae]